MSEANREMSGLGVLERARAMGVLSALDYQFATRLADLFDERDAGIRWALAVACRQEAAGHVCADLVRLLRDGLVTEIAGEARTVPLLATHDSLDAWLDDLARSPLVARPGSANETENAPRPLVLDDRGRLFLLRSHRRQESLADRIRERAARASYGVDWHWAELAIERLAAGDAEEMALPRRALRVGLARPLAIVTGGPGTGKTTMVARLIALLALRAHESGEAPPRVRLLAPTGKAAAAMANAFARGRETLGVPEEVRAGLPTSAETIQRALHGGSRLDAFGRPSKFALDADVVVVDEASMVDLELMDRLFSACENVPRVILLGDPGQLASVDSGAVLAELCAGVVENVRAASASGAVPGMSADLAAQGDLFSAPPRPQAAEPSAADTSLEVTPASPAKGLAASIVTLRKSHRFDAQGGIGRLAEAIRAGDADAVLALLQDPGIPEVERCAVDSSEGLVARLVEESRRLQHEIGGASGPEEKLERMGLYRVLCAHRRGPFGVESIAARLDEAAAAVRHTTPRSGWWLGRMLLVTRNAPDQDLWNGDVGLIEETGQGLRALFPDGAGGVRALSAGRLPSVESAIAMSVHKSQGSEFDVVDLVLGEAASPLMTRELLYTGVTRARRQLRIHASEPALRAMIERRIQRDSGLGERLWVD